MFVIIVIGIFQLGLPLESEIGLLIKLVVSWTS